MDALYIPGGVEDTLVTDVEFTDDIALTTEHAVEADDLPLSVELAANSIGLHLNGNNTKHIGVHLSDSCQHQSSKWRLEKSLIESMILCTLEVVS